jgi:hypothetical protein
MGAPSWCLNEEALKRFNRSSVDIPVYDYDTDDTQDNTDNSSEHEGGIPNRTISNGKKRRKAKKKSKKRDKKRKSR